MPKSLGSWIGCVGFMLCLTSSSAFADFQVAGTTSGQFYLGSTALGNSLWGLTFNGADFGPTGNNTTVTMGTFDLSTWLSYFDPFDFKMSMSFTAPPGAGGTAFTADLSGFVTLVGGAVTIDFRNNGLQTLTYTNSQGSGSFDLKLTNVTLSNYTSAQLQGTISNATFTANPEPGTLLLTTALLGGLAVAFRRRLRV